MTIDHIKAAQRKLQVLGYYSGIVDGDFGPASLVALNKALVGIAPKKVPELPPFDKQSAEEFENLHPELQKVVAHARKKIAFQILDSTRGRAAQTAAYKSGNSKATFGNSAHNYKPAIACDIVPIPLDWNNLAAFIAIQAVIGYYNPQTGKGSGSALELKVPLRWGGDWNLDGNTKDGWDFPHYELHPWRDFAKQSKLFEG